MKDNNETPNNKNLIEMKPNSRHGMTGTKFYKAWGFMKTKGNYDMRWEIFNNFYTDMYREYLDLASNNDESRICLGTIDMSKEKSKSNTRWMTRVERNRTRKNIPIYKYNGESMNLYDWSDRLGLSKGSLESRIRKGWSNEQALSKKKGDRVHKPGPTGRRLAMYDSVTGERMEFESSNACADFLNYDRSTLWRMVNRNGKVRKRYTFRYLS